MLLSKEQIFAANDLQSVDVEVPEWGGSVKVKAMSAIDRINFEKSQKDMHSSELIIQLVILTCIDKDGNRLFTNDDLEQLQEKSPNAILRIFNEAIKLNLLNDDKLEEKAENFQKGHS